MTAILDRMHITHHDSDSVDGPSTGDRRVTILGTLVIVAGLILGLAGAGTWAMVQTSLADERVTVAEDAERFAGQDVNGPFTAYYEADIIETHALETPVARPTPSSTARTRSAPPS